MFRQRARSVTILDERPGERAREALPAPYKGQTPFRRVSGFFCELFLDERHAADSLDGL